jgi:hypothetical protein
LKTFYRISVADVPRTDLILWYYDPEPGMRILPCYADLICPSCGKLDELAALRRRISPEVRIRNTKRDACASFDMLYVLSARARQTLEAVAPGEVAYYPIPSAPEFFVALPELLLRPTRDSDAFQFGDVRPLENAESYPAAIRDYFADLQSMPRCPSCGRDREVIFGPGRLELPETARIGAVALENPTVGLMPAWFADQEVARALKKAKHKGWDIRPW